MAGLTKVIVAIPACNEAQFIGEVIAKARNHVDEVIVVDDGSMDNTSEVARTHGARVIKHQMNQGVGAATRTAFEAIMKGDADILVTLDGDGQHNADEIPLLLAPIINRKADLVIGSRFIQSNYQQMPRYRKFGIDFITFLYNFGARTKITDSQSGFRAYSRRLIESVNITDAGFGFSVQVLIQARKKGLDIKEVPISCIYHSQSSSRNPIAHGLAVAFGVLRYRLLSR
ncbi:MAG: glycosyltransferase family 2 protein [Chloroflexota bacterium]